MKIGTAEEKVLACIQHCALDPIPSLARKTGLKTHVVRYAVSRLKEAGIITGPRPFVNLFPLGYSSYLLYFSIAAASQRKRILGDRWTEAMYDRDKAIKKQFAS